MCRPAFWLLIVSSLLVVFSVSFAQEQTGDSGVQGQDWTGVDISWISASEAIVSWFEPNLSSWVLTWILTDSWTDSGENIFSIQSFSTSGNSVISGIVTETPLPQLIISEVFFDGSDEWLELTNLSSEPFSGSLTLTGIGINASFNAEFSSGESVVLGRSGRDFSYFLDQTVIRYFASMGFTDTKAIAISLSRSWQLVDQFLADTGMVTHYNDKKTSLEKAPSSTGYIITWTSRPRQLNVTSDYLANPGSFRITVLDFSSGSDGISGAGDTGSLPSDCLLLSPAPLFQLSEVFRGNEQRDFFIEILALQDFSGDSFTLSGSFLASPIIVSLDSIWNHLEQGRRLIISSGQKRKDEQILSLDNQGLAASESGGWLEILLGSGQSGQVMDIASIGAKIVGSSLYLDPNSTGCMGNLTRRWWFSPWFDEQFLKYFPGTTWYKILCDAPKPTSSIAPTSCQSPIVSDPKVITTTLTGSETIPDTPKNIHITFVDYDPPGSDTSNEKITLLGSWETGERSLLLQKPDWYLKINSTKRYLSGLLISNEPLTLLGSFSFPNSSKSGVEIEVQLRYQNELLDTYKYLPGKIVSVALTGSDPISTGSYLVTEVVDGDTIKILSGGSTESVRLLWIDAPEVSLLRTKKKGCRAEQSKQYLSNLILGKQIQVSLDPTQQKKDSYKRRLFYLYLDGELINQQMVAEGYAKEYTFKVPYTQRPNFLSAQTSAQEDVLGLWDPNNCPENAVRTGAEITGIVEDSLSWLSAQILRLIPNPKGKDDKEQLALKVETLSLQDKKGWDVETWRNLLSGFSLSINGKKKIIRDRLPIGEETILSWNLGLLNKASCVSLVFQTQTLATLCYPQPKEGETIYADGTKDFILDPVEQSLLSSFSLKTIGTTMCAFYGDIQIDCNNIPSGKTALKTKNENKLYESFIKILQTYLQQNRWDVYYQSNVYPYFTLLRASKKDISAWSSSRTTPYGEVPVYDISAQIQLLETYSPAYRAKKFGQILLNEI